MPVPWILWGLCLVFFSWLVRKKRWNERMSCALHGYLRGWFQWSFDLHPYLGKIPIWTNIFSNRLKPPTRPDGDETSLIPCTKGWWWVSLPPLKKRTAGTKNGVATKYQGFSEFIVVTTQPSLLSGYHHYHFRHQIWSSSLIHRFIPAPIWMGLPDSWFAS